MALLSIIVIGCAEDIISQDQNLYKAILDVNSLFTNLPLDETIDICVSLLFKDSDVVNVLTKEGFP